MRLWARPDDAGAPASTGLRPLLGIQSPPVLDLSTFPFSWLERVVLPRHPRYQYICSPRGRPGLDRPGRRRRHRRKQASNAQSRQPVLMLCGCVILVGACPYPPTLALPIPKHLPRPLGIPPAYVTRLPLAGGARCSGGKARRSSPSVPLMPGPRTPPGQPATVNHIRAFQKKGHVHTHE